MKRQSVVGEWNLIGHSEGVEGVLLLTPDGIWLTRHLTEEQDGFDVYVGDEVIDLGPDLGCALRMVAGLQYVGITTPDLTVEELCRTVSSDFGQVLGEGFGLSLNGFYCEVVNGRLIPGDAGDGWI